MTTSAEKKRALPPDVYDSVRACRVPNAERLLDKAESGAKASNLAARALRDELAKAHAGADYADMSDWVECLAGEEYPLGVGHGASYWTRKAKWLGGGAEGKRKACEVELVSEAWAELCDSALANKASYLLLREYFPSAVK